MKNLLNLSLACLLGISLHAQNFSIGNQLFIDGDGDNVFQDDGVAIQVIVNLWTVENGMPIMLLESQITDDQGMYLFENLDSATYLIEVPQDNFEPGGSLENFVSCEGGASATDGVDNDDNGIENVSGDNSVWSTFIDFSVLDGDEMIDQTVDFCFEFFSNQYDYQPTCAEAELIDPICSIQDFDNLLGTMFAEESEGDVPMPLCPNGGMANNMTWFSFVAGSEVFSFDIIPSNCTTSSTFSGFQIGVYADCTFTEAIFCESECSTGPVSITAGNTSWVPGKTYYVFIDGCGGSVCDFEINHTSGVLACDMDVEECEFAQIVMAETQEDCFAAEIVNTIQDQLVDNLGPSNLTCIEDDNLVTWYQFEIIGDSTEFIMAHVEANGFDPVWSFYTGFACDDFDVVEAVDQFNETTYECSNSDGLIYNNHFIPYDSNKTYWLAISHVGEVLDSSFTLTYSSYKNCPECSQSSSFECRTDQFTAFVDGEIFDGPFARNSEVTVCVDLVWNDASNTWIHGIIPNFGKGWDVNSAGPDNVTIAGGWEWVDAEGECATNLSIYELPNICSYEEGGVLKLCNRACNPICPCEGSLVPDSPLPSGWFSNSPGGGNSCVGQSCTPLDNYGLISGVNVTLDFCFDLKVKGDLEEDCFGNKDLQISFILTGDAITGCWEDNACTKPLTLLSPEWEINCTSPPSVQNIAIAICSDDLPFSYEGISVDENSPAVTMLDDYILPNTTASDGGDSVVNIIIEILDADVIVGVECDMNEYVLKANALTSIDTLIEESYTWLNGITEDTLGSLNEITIDYNVSEVLLIYEIGKSGTYCQFFTEINLTQDTLTSPPLSIMGQDSLCSSAPSGVYTAEESSDSDGLAYKWEITEGSGTLMELTLDNTIFVSWTSNFGTLCAVALKDCAASEPICLDVNIFDGPSADFSWNIIDGSTDVVQFIYEGSEPVQNYFWEFGDGITSTEMSPLHQYMDTDQVYQVTLTVALDACESTIMEDVDLLLDDINDIHEIESLIVSPNPSKGLIFIDMKLSKSIDLQMQIMDLHGRVLIDEMILNTNKDVMKQIDLSHIPSGTYLLRFISGDQVRIVKIVMQ